MGQALGQQLSSANYKIHLLTRKAQQKIPYPCKVFSWPDVQTEIPPEAFPKNENYGVIHLLGEPVSQWPWSKHKKEKIYNSRFQGTKNLVETLKKQEPAPQFFLSASAIGIYSEKGNHPITEASPISNQNLFLQTVCKDWEEEALKISSVCRTLIFRLGIVMSYKKGFLYEQTQWLKRGLYPLVISRRPHWLSWIALEDLIRMMVWAVENKSAQGIYNAVSPHPILLKDFYRTLSQKIQSKSLPVPSPLFLMKWAGGEMTKNLLTSCKALPEKALSQGFVFQQSQIETALKVIRNTASTES